MPQHFEKPEDQLDFEISFLDGRGKLRCSFTARFQSGQAAARYAESVMLTRRCRHFASAEISTLDMPQPILVPRAADRSGPTHRRHQEQTPMRRGA